MINNPSTITGSKLFLLLLDGFRWDYFNLGGLELKGFPRLFQEGVKAEYMIPSYPTNSYPNYYTLMTGLYVEDHGVVGNHMWDEETGERFEMGGNPESYNSHWWEFAEPLWITATKQGKKFHMYHWIECNISIHDTLPTYCLPYTGIPTRRDIQSAMKSGVAKLQQGADAVYVYHEAVDHDGHWYGPNSNEVRRSVQEIDEDISMLLDEISAHDIADQVNIMVFSDHGMTAIDELHKINISKALDMDEIKAISEAMTTVALWPQEGLEEKVYNKLKQFDSEHLKVFYNRDIHDRWFFKKHRRIPPIFLTTDPGWYIVHPQSGNTYAERDNRMWLGNHGFDNAEESMRSIFVAKGPNFKRNFAAKAFPSVDMYQIMCKILDVSPQPNNGTWNNVRDLLLDRDTHLEL